MAPPRCNEELETTQEKFTSDKQYNKLARAVRRSIVCHDKLQTSQDEPQEEARRDAKDASKKTLDALDAFTRRPMTAANAPVKYLTTDDERHVARKLYADILAEMKRRAEDPSSKAMPLPSLAEFAGFDVPLEGDRGGKEEPRGCLPSKFTPVGEEDEDNDTTSSGNVTPKPSELVPLARSPIKNPSTQHVQDTVMVDPEGK